MSGEEEDCGEYVIEKIVDDEDRDGVRHFKVRWEGYNESDDTWEPETRFDDCRAVITAYLSERANEPAEIATEPEQKEVTEPVKEDEKEKEEEAPEGSETPKRAVRTSPIVTRLQYQKSFFGSGSDGENGPPSGSDGSEPGPPIRRRKRPAPKKKTSTKTKARSRPMRLMDDISDDEYRSVDGVTVVGDEMQFVVKRKDGKIRHVAKDDMKRYHTKLYLNFIERLVSLD